jgi:putative oxidoreductase
MIKTLLFGGAGAVTKLGDFGLLVTRVGLGLLMAVGHGYGKLFHDGTFGPAKQFIDGTRAMGFPAPTLFAWMAALTEFVGGLLLAAGLLTRPVALFLTFNMAVAAFLAHKDAPLFMSGSGPSKEPALLYMLPFFAFIFLGCGRFGVDALLRGRRPRGRGFEVT